MKDNKIMINFDKFRVWRDSSRVKLRILIE